MENSSHSWYKTYVKLPSPALLHLQLGNSYHQLLETMMGAIFSVRGSAPTREG